jgi:hypothetical protein
MLEFLLWSVKALGNKGARMFNSYNKGTKKHRFVSIKASFWYIYWSVQFSGERVLDCT